MTKLLNFLIHTKCKQTIDVASLTTLCLYKGQISECQVSQNHFRHALCHFCLFWKHGQRNFLDIQSRNHSTILAIMRAERVQKSFRIIRDTGQVYLVFYEFSFYSCQSTYNINDKYWKSLYKFSYWGMYVQIHTRNYQIMSMNDSMYVHDRRTFTTIEIFPIY